MLHYTIIFLVIALITTVFGFGNIAADTTKIAKILFIVFLILAVANFLVNAFRR